MSLQESSVASPSIVGVQRSRAGDRSLVFVHGFLDDQSVWDTTVAALAAPRYAIVQIDLAGVGDRADAPGPFTLERFADDVAAVVSSLGGSVVLVGQSMGAQVAELVAARLPEAVTGLVLLTPVPLAGTHMAPDMLAQFHAVADQPAARGEFHRMVMATVTPEMIAQFTRTGEPLSREIVRDQVAAWDGGHPAGRGPSAYTGPVLILPGSGDWFINAEAIAAGVLPRFPHAETVTIDQAGHWPHVEQPAAVAGALDAFLARLA